MNRNGVAAAELGAPSDGVELANDGMDLCIGAVESGVMFPGEIESPTCKVGPEFVEVKGCGILVGEESPEVGHPVGPDKIAIDASDVGSCIVDAAIESEGKSVFDDNVERGGPSCFARRDDGISIEEGVSVKRGEFLKQGGLLKAVSWFNS